MKKSSFLALVMGTISLVLFSLGMCMALIAEWNAFKPGVIFGSIGILIGLLTVAIWRKMEHKDPINLSGKTILMILISIVGALTFGIGMCLCLVWSKMILGIFVGLIGITILLCLIPLTKGLHK